MQVGIKTSHPTYLSNKNFAISTLCFVGLKLDDLNLFKILNFFKIFSAVYNYSKEKIYIITYLNQVKQISNYAKK